MESPVEMGPSRGSSASVGGPLTAPAAFHVLAKPTGAICNLDCTYCFFLSKESLYPGDRFRMSDEVLDAYVSQLLAGHGPGEVTIAWQGGEPTLMGVDFFRRARHRGRAPPATGTDGPAHHPDQRHAAHRRVGAGCSSSNGFLVGISIDGPHERCTTRTGSTSAASRPSTR